VAVSLIMVMIAAIVLLVLRLFGAGPAT